MGNKKSVSWQVLTLRIALWIRNGTRIRARLYFLSLNALRTCVFLHAPLREVLLGLCKHYNACQIGWVLIAVKHRTIPGLLSFRRAPCTRSCMSAQPSPLGRALIILPWAGERESEKGVIFLLYSLKESWKINICARMSEGGKCSMCLWGLVSQQRSSEEQSANPRLSRVLTSQLYCLHLGWRMAGWLISSSACRL